MSWFRKRANTRSPATAVDEKWLQTEQDLLAPDGVEWRADDCRIGPLYCRLFQIINYPAEAALGWLGDISQLQGVVVSVQLEALPPEDVAAALNRAIQQTVAFAAETRRATDQIEQEIRAESAEAMLRTALAAGDPILTVSIGIEVRAESEEELTLQAGRVRDFLAGRGFRVAIAKHMQEQAALASGPWALLPPEIGRFAPRWMPAETIAAAYPFAGAAMNHGRGIYLGRDHLGGVVVIDRWNLPAQAGSQTNSNMAIFGASGSGKSHAAKAIIYREWLQGTHVVIIDPEREYGELARHVGGHVVRADGGEDSRINPLEVPDADEDAVGDPLAQHLRQLLTWAKLYRAELTDSDLVALEAALYEVYAAAGITTATVMGYAGPWPTLVDLHSHLEQSGTEAGKRLAGLLRPAALGTDAPLWSGQTTAERDTDFLVLDTHDLDGAPEHLKRAQYFLLLNFAWDLVRRGRYKHRTLLVVDEAWLMVDPRVPEAIDFLQAMAKRIRKYQGSLIVATQNLQDFLAEDIRRQGEGVLNNAATALLLRQGDRDLEQLTQLKRLSEAEQQLLRQAERGQGLLIVGTQRGQVNIEIMPHEEALFGGGGGR